MAQRRIAGINHCPIDDQPISYEKCHACPYYRGHIYNGYLLDIACNWPRSGSHIAPTEVPAAFHIAFDNDPEGSLQP